MSPGPTETATVLLSLENLICSEESRRLEQQMPADKYEVLPTIFKSEIGWCSVDWPFFHYHSGVLNSGVRIEHYINTFKTQAQSYTDTWFPTCYTIVKY